MQCLRWVRNCANNLLLYKQNDISDSDHWQIFCSIANSSWHRLRNFIFEKVNGFVLGCNIRCKMNAYIPYFLRNNLIFWMHSCSYNYYENTILIMNLLNIKTWFDFFQELSTSNLTGLGQENVREISRRMVHSTLSPSLARLHTLDTAV